MKYKLENRINPSPWFEAGRALDGEKTWEALIEYHTKNLNKAYCIYVHVPYCPEVCSYCALYKEKIPEDSDIALNIYYSALNKNIENHAVMAPFSAPTTVHFGGGTPISLGKDRLGKIIEAISKTFSTDSSTEWAIETTSSSISNDLIRFFKNFNLSRVHVGVQTLDDNIRSGVNRRESGNTVLTKIEMLLSAGFDVSVDLIVGLPGQNVSSLDCDLKTLFSAGLRTFSVSELVEMKTGKELDLVTTEERELNFRLWMYLYSYLLDKGLKPIHYGQFAVDTKDNMYYTFPTRGEDCLSLGAYAHGWFGNCFYGNKLTPEFIESFRQNEQFQIDFGYDYGKELADVRAFETGMLSNRIQKILHHKLAVKYGLRFTNLWDQWIDSELIKLNDLDSVYSTVTATGNWFLGNMVNDLRRIV